MSLAQSWTTMPQPDPASDHPGFTGQVHSGAQQGAEAGQPRCVFLPTASVSLQRKWPRNRWVGLGPEETPSPLALCQNHFRYPEMGCGRGAGAPACGPLARTWRATPGHQHLQQWHQVKGTSGRPRPTPGPSHLFSVRHRTLEIHVLYDGEKKVPNVPPKRQYILYFVKC